MNIDPPVFFKTEFLQEIPGRKFQEIRDAVDLFGGKMDPPLSLATGPRIGYIQTGPWPV